MKALWSILTSSIGKKIIMGVTGFALVAFVFVHMAGNLQIFLGQEALNNYAHMLKAVPEVLWMFRLGLLAMVVLHIAAAAGLVLENRASRPLGYVAEKNAASYASRTMIWSGLIVLSFIVYHLLHFTVQVTNPEYRDMKAPLEHLGNKLVPDVYHMVIAGFSSPWVSGFYILSVGLLCLHMSHGVQSMFQSLGLRNKRSAPFLDTFSVAYAVLIFLGMSAVPAAVLLQIVK
jgi:succinate dehydrogenase / fumarate reductase cytochrome b subunit